MKHRLCVSLVLSLATSGYIWAERGDVAFGERFDTPDDLARWSIIDLNGGRTWEYLEGKAAYMLDWQTSLPGDDWLISPAFELKARTAYELHFDMGVLTKTESMRVCWGASAEPETLARQPLADYHDVTAKDSGAKTIRFVTQEAGSYYLGYYAYSQPDQHRIEVDNIEVVEIGSSSLPAAVDQLSATADAEGGLSAQITFVVPTLALDGEPLSGLTKACLYRADQTEPLMQWSDLQPGATLAFTDTHASQGINTYRVEVENVSGTNQAAEVSVYVGNDTPAATAAVKLSLTADRGVKVSWQPVTQGVHQGYLDASGVTYRVKRGNKTVYEGASCEYVDDSQADSDPQRTVRYSVTPSCHGLTGALVQSAYIGVGRPLTLPYAESFANAKTVAPWYQDPEVNDFGWACAKTPEDTEYEICPQDGDNGFLLSESRMGEVGEQSRYISPIFNFGQTLAPCLTFWFYEGRSPWYDPENDGVINDRLQWQYRTLEGEWQDVKDALYYQNVSSDGWVECQVLLPRCDGKDLVLGLLATSDAPWSAYHDIAIDNVTIVDAGIEHEVACEGIAVDSRRISIGQSLQLAVKVNNRLESAENEVNVSLYRNQELYASETLAIAGMSDEVATFGYTATYDDSRADSIVWQAVVEAHGDAMAWNNVSPTICTSVRPNDVPTVTGLQASCSGLDATIRWTASYSVDPQPKGDPITVTDDFEQYEPFITQQIGHWTTIDGDGATTLATGRIPVAYPHQGEPMAFQVFDVEQAGVWCEGNYDEAFEPMEGSKRYLCCPSTDYPAENDDWLITPRLDGRSHVVSFWAHAATYDAEWIKVYYSLTDTHPDSFLPLTDDDAIVYVHEGWHRLEYEVPDEARYMAVRCVRRSVFLGIDQFTYQCHDGKEDPRTLLGYNIYRDGTRVNEQLLTAPCYVDRLSAAGEYIYQVTAVYAEGESPYSEPLLLDTEAAALTPVGLDMTAPKRLYDLLGRPVAAPSRGGFFFKN